MRVTQNVISSRISDIEIDGKTFEVGGKRKNKNIVDQRTAFTSFLVNQWFPGLNKEHVFYLFPQSLFFRFPLGTPTENRTRN